jgi:uncharacterized repeat protein (TIGR01451 family)
MATFNNFATLSYNGLTAISNLVTGEIVDSLQMMKTAVAESYTPGGSITYAVSVVNVGGADYSGLTLSDDLGAYAYDTRSVVPLDYQAGSLQYYVNGALQPAPAVVAGPPLSVTGITVPAGGNAMILYTVRANEYAPPCSEGNVQNTATLTGAALPDALTATAEILPECAPELSIAKAITPAAVRQSGEISYTFVITNNGAKAAEEADNVTVIDNFTPVLSGLTVTLNGSALSLTQYTYDSTTGVFATKPGVITVPAAAFTQDPVSGLWTRSPGVATLTVSGTI